MQRVVDLCQALRQTRTLGLLVGLPGVGKTWAVHSTLSSRSRVFVRNGPTWAQQAKLTASDGAAQDLLGYSVAISGDTAIAGAYLDDDGGTDTGSVYVFTRSGTTWTQQAKLTASDAAAGDCLGIGVAISGDTVIAGAWLDDEVATDSGSAYVFNLAPNLVPISNAGPDQTVLVNELVTLDGSASYDPNSDPLSYAWSEEATNPETGLLSDPTAVNPTFTPSIPGFYTFTLVVNDGVVDSEPDSVVITVQPEPNESPIAIAGTSLDANNQLELNGSLSTDPDPDGTIVSYSWQISGEPSPRTGQIVSIADLTPGNYTVDLTVTDDEGATSIDTMLLGVPEVVVPPPTGGAIQQQIADIRSTIQSLPLNALVGPNDNAKEGHRQAFIDMLDGVSNLVSGEDYQAAIDELRGLLQKTDGLGPPDSAQDWVTDDPSTPENEQEDLAQAIAALIDDLLAICTTCS